MTRPAPIDPKVVRQGIADGRSCRQIARDLGTSAMTIYRTADKAGVQARRGRVAAPVTLRHAVQDMRPLEALEYALEAYEALSGQDMRPEDEPPVHLSAQQRPMYQLLKRRLGRTVPFGAITAVMDAAAMDATTGEKVMKVQICHMRRKLAGRFTITNVRNIGYRMDSA